VSEGRDCSGNAKNLKLTDYLSFSRFSIVVIAMSYFKFIDEFHLTDLSVQKILRGKAFTWKGVEWSTELHAKTTGDIAVYLGFETPSTLPDDFSEPVEFRYSLLSMDNVELCSGK
jgi:hypothetical protein